MASPPEQPLGFSWLLHDKSGELQIRRDGRVVTLMRGDQARRLQAALGRCGTEADAQRLLARATGNYKRGNERRG